MDAAFVEGNQRMEMAVQNPNEDFSELDYSDSENEVNIQYKGSQGSRRSGDDSEEENQTEERNRSRSRSRSINQ